MKKVLSLALVAALLLIMFVGCGKTNNSGTGETKEDSDTQVKDGKAKDAYDAALKAVFGKETPILQPIPDEESGLKSEMYNEVVSGIPDMNTMVDTLIVVEAKDGQADTVETTLKAYGEKILKDREAFPYLPDHLPKAKYAKVVKVGNYVAYVSIADTGLVEDTDNLDKYVQEDIDKAVKAVTNALSK